MKSILLASLFLVSVSGTTVHPDAVRHISNPSLMHMHRREFIAAAALQGLLAHYGAAITPKEAADKTVEYTDALMEKLDD